MNDIKRQVREFLNDKSKKKIEIDVPNNFKVRGVVNPIKLLYRKSVFFIQQWIIPCHFKNWLVGTAGVDMGYDVCLPHYIQFDPYFPELITIGKGSLIGGLTTFNTHELKDGKFILGRIDIKEKVLTAGYSTIYPGVTVNKYVITGMRCEIRKDCPEKSFVVSKDRVVKEWNKEELEKYFADPTNDPNYYNELKQKTKEFRKNQDMMKISFKNGGKRLNPGDEWYLSRPWPRIFYNAAFVELARFTPTNFLRKLLMRCIGVKFGKNVYMGKNVVFDHIYGDLVTVGNNVYLDDGAYLDGHSYTIAETVFGRVHIGDNTKLGKDVHVMCGVKIGKNCTILDNSSVLRDIPDGETWGGIPAKKKGGEGNG